MRADAAAVPASWRVFAIAIACAWSVAGTAPAVAAEADASITFEATTRGLSGAGANARITVRARGDGLRVDLHGAPGRGDQGSLVVDPDSGGAFLLSPDGGTAIPLAKTGFEALRVDPDAPCARMQADCERAPGDIVAGLPVEGWHYDDADGRGPDGTSRGTLWLDRASGMVLAFRGEVTGRAGRREMRATTVSRAALDMAVFLPPDATAAATPAPR